MSLFLNLDSKFWTVLCAPSENSSLDFLPNELYLVGLSELFAKKAVQRSTLEKLYRRVILTFHHYQ